MKSIFIIFIIFTGVVLLNNFALAQSNSAIEPQDTTALMVDSVQTVNKNAVIQSTVNKDGVIEITRKEFDKIPPVRQELIKKDKNFKIIEN